MSQGRKEDLTKEELQELHKKYYKKYYNKLIENVIKEFKRR